MALRDRAGTSIGAIAWICLATSTACTGLGDKHVATSAPESTSTETVTTHATPLAGWHKLDGRGVSMWLPESFIGGDLQNDVAVIRDRLKSLGPGGAALARQIEANPTLFVFWVFDSDASDLSVPTNVNIVRQEVLSSTTLNAYLDAIGPAISKVLPNAQVVSRENLDVAGYDAGRLVVEFDAPSSSNLTAFEVGARAEALIYVLKNGNTVYQVTFGTSGEAFNDLVPTFDRAIDTFAAEPIQGSSPSTDAGATPAGCAKDARVSVVDEPIGRRFSDGDHLTITLNYDTPNCDHVSGVVFGVHQVGSPYHDYWCVKHVGSAAPCGRNGLPSRFSLLGAAIAHSGTVTLEAKPGSYPPRDLGAVPSLEGFMPCFVQVTFGDGTFGGSSYEYDVGTRCGGEPIPPASRETAVVPPPTQPPATGAHCGEGLSAQFSGTAPLNRIFHDGDQLPASVSYSAPGCDSARAYFDGFFSPSTPWCQYWLDHANSAAAENCRGEGIASSLPGGLLNLDAPSGTLRFVAASGSIPPQNESSLPNLEGMRYCGVLLRFYSSDRFPQDVFLGDQCFFGPRLQ